MIPVEDLSGLLQAAFPDGAFEIIDRNGMRDHYIIRVTSAQFATVGIMDRHRMVMDALKPAYADGRLHAAEIQTALPGP